MTTASLKVPFAEYSSFTAPSVPALVQVMVWVEPTTHVSPPLGAVRAREPRILKFCGDVWVTVVSLLRMILTLTVVEIASGTVQAKLPPAAGVEAVTWVVWVSSEKPFVEYSSFTVAIVQVGSAASLWIV